MPESEDPKPPNEEAVDLAHNLSPANLTDEEYHQISEDYMDTVNEKAEALQESRQDVEVEYAVRIPVAVLQHVVSIYIQSTDRVVLPGRRPQHRLSPKRNLRDQ